MLWPSQERAALLLEAASTYRSGAKRRLPGNPDESGRANPRAHPPARTNPTRPSTPQHPPPALPASDRGQPTSNASKTQMPSAPAKFAPKRSSHAEYDADRKQTAPTTRQARRRPAIAPQPPHPHRTPRTLDAGKRGRRRQRARGK
eukprot:4548587-Prymnesium_polylepis.3